MTTSRTASSATPAKQTPYIGVIGSATPDERLAAWAEEVGGGIARAGAVLVCGGLMGVMEAACRGAKSAGGTSIGILPGTDRSAANRYVDIALTTGIGEMRNVLIVRATDALIAIGGGWGTLSEIGFALKTGRAVVGLETWPLRGAEAGAQDAIVRTETPEQAVEAALELAGAVRGR